MTTQRIMVALFLGSLLFASRFIPHPANFTPFLAIALFIGYRFRESSLAFTIPIAAIFISDLWLGFYEGWFFVYLAFAIAGILGRSIKPTTLSVLGATLSVSLVFFALSNFGVWYATALYAKTFAGLVQCYTAALPFFHRTLASTMVYSVLIFSMSFVTLRAFYSRLAEK